MTGATGSSMVRGKGAVLGDNTMHRAALTILPLLAALAGTPATHAADAVAISHEEIIDQPDSDIARELSMSLEDQLAAGLVYIDWRIVELGTGDDVPITTEACHAAGDSGTVHVDLDSLSFSPYRNFHAVITVTAGDPQRFPLNAIECQQDMIDPMIYTVRIRGLYFVLSATIPTANSYDLRPG